MVKDIFSFKKDCEDDCNYEFSDEKSIRLHCNELKEEQRKLGTLYKPIVYLFGKCQRLDHKFKFINAFIRYFSSYHCPNCRYLLVKKLVDECEDSLSSEQEYLLSCDTCGYEYIKRE